MSSRLHTSHAAMGYRPCRLIVACAGLVLSGVAAGFVNPGPAAAAAAGPPPVWYAATQPARAFSEEPAVACAAGGADCAAIGTGTTCAKLVGAVCVTQSSFNVAEYSRDGGATWAGGTVPTAANGQFIQLASVSCSRVTKGRTSCAAWALLTQEDQQGPSAQVSYFSADGGVTWSVGSPPAAIDQDAWQSPVLSCYEVNLEVDCAGAPASLGVEYSTDGGASWAPSVYHQSPAFGALAAQDFSCAVSRSQMDCAAVGYVFDATTKKPVDTVWYSTDGGKSWAPGKLAQREGELNTVSCVAAKGQVRCAALGTETTGGITANVAVYSVDGGRSWSTSAFPAHTELPSPWGNVSCAVGRSGVDCAASGSALLFSGNGGASWLPAEDPNRAGGDIACLPSSPGPTCYVVGGKAARSYDGGATWSASKVARGFAVEDTMLRDNIACISPSECVVAGPGKLFTTQPVVGAG